VWNSLPPVPEAAENFFSGRDEQRPRVVAFFAILDDV